ncbi:hypothetical protein BU019_04060 [Staphylococcus simulans]|nr:hypothetical protein BU053_10115 [Staphylococcus simulans]PTI93626.1 hypothetical protein BU045_05480 [Staphylococcus simulans]PTJ01457.1 hypothetical protein BU047_10440 [Staphylococcus simulans]PTJ04056.1 hypothetical protein BU046_09780 [Staphylococcus simulans]PTJ09548.1 hypothetical protein BU044_09145 [Staphylococcus simulans]
MKMYHRDVIRIQVTHYINISCLKSMWLPYFILIFQRNWFMASLIFFVGLTCLRLTDHPILKRKGAIHMAGDIVGTIGEFVKLIIETVQKFTQK